VWGAVIGGVQAATPLVFWWLNGGVGFALGLALIASV
jgi:hypothetical protein